MRQCPDCPTREKSFFCSLAGGHLARLDREKIAHEYRRGQVIFHEGTPALAVYCVFSGVVKLYKAGRNDKQVMIRLLRRGDIMGYRAVMAGEVFAATAEAVENTVVCTISREAIFDLLREDTDLALGMMAKLARELRVSEDEMVVRLHDSVVQRTARFLLLLAKGLGSEESPSLKISLPMRREDIANMIGTTPESLSRCLHDLARRGVLSIDRRHLVIRKLDKLRQIAPDDT